MPKAKTTEPDPDMRDEYDFAGGVRGKYAARYRCGTNVVVIDPDLVALFPDAASVNEALRSLAVVAKRAAESGRRAKLGAA